MVQISKCNRQGTIPLGGIVPIKDRLRGASAPEVSLPFCADKLCKTNLSG